MKVIVLVADFSSSYRAIDTGLQKQKKKQKQKTKGKKSTQKINRTIPKGNLYLRLLVLKI
jgi:hypothetical protein